MLKQILIEEKKQDDLSYLTNAFSKPKDKNFCQKILGYIGLFFSSTS